MKNYYQILGVAPDADPDEIKKAYRALAKKYHPDANPDDEEMKKRFQEITDAYMVLSDPDTRQQYDYLGHDLYEQSAKHTTGRRSYEEEEEDDDDGHCGACKGRGPIKEEEGPPPKSIRIAVYLTLTESLYGAEKTVQVVYRETCEHCRGENAKVAQRDCPQCGGSGKRIVYEPSSWGKKVRKEKHCYTCHGTGKVPRDPCPVCRGLGYVDVEKDVRVRIPAHAYEKQFYFLKDVLCEGEDEILVEGKNLVVIVLLHDQPDFIRQQYHLFSSQEVSFEKMVLGGTIRLHTLEGEVDYPLEAGTQDGSRIRLIRRGLYPPPMVGGRGDQYVTLHVRIPTVLTDKQIHALRGYQSSMEEGA